jgi:predicted HicB family RNase H-like nuclease
MGTIINHEESKSERLKTLHLDEETHQRVKVEATAQRQTIQEWVTATLLAALPKLNAKVRKGGN